MIRADLLGNPWAQEWGNIFPLVAPPAEKQPYDVTELLKAKAHRRPRHGEVRRRLLHVAGLCAAAQDLLGSFAVHQAARS